MRFLLRTWLLFYAFGFLPAQPAAAGPSVFIGASKGDAWWIRKTVIVRPMGKVIEGFDLRSINAFRDDNEVMPDPICFLEGAEAGSFVGLDRSTETEIRSTFGEQTYNVFRQEFSTLDGREFVARIAFFQVCGAADPGSLLLIFEKGTRAIVLFRSWPGDPFTFLHPGKAPGVLGFTSCFNCGDWNSVYYDVTRRRFYSEAEGD